MRQFGKLSPEVAGRRIEVIDGTGENPMGVEIDVVYQGQLRCLATHGPSKTQLITDPPIDNQGKGQSFSPTDLVATALGTCVMSLMAIVAERNKLDIVGTKVHVVKEMIQQPVRRIGALRVTVTVPAEKATKLTSADRTKMETAAEHCPVHKSIHPDIEAPIAFVYE